MTTRSWLGIVAVLAAAAVALALAGPCEARAMAGAAELDGLRVPFIENQGQLDARVAYYAPTFAGTLYVTRRGELVYSLPARSASESPDRGWTVTETLAGGTTRPVGTGGPGGGVSYFIGDDPARWLPHVPSFAGVSLGEVWPGVTVELRAGGRNVEKVFTVAPGAPPDRIRVRVDGARALAVDAEGALVVATGRGPVRFTAPVAYQDHDGERRPVAVTYRLSGRRYGFAVAAYDRARPLVIDPLLRSTYLGGNANDAASALAIHPVNGHVYVVGVTNSTDFPGVAGGAQQTKGDFSIGSAFVARLTSDLTTLVQATFLGGSTIGCTGPHQCFPGDSASAVAIHPVNGDVYVAGTTFSMTFPGTGGGAQATGNGFVSRLTPSLTTLVQSTYLDAGPQTAGGLAVHPTTGDVYAAIGALVRLNGALTSLAHGPAFTQTGAFGAKALVAHTMNGDLYVGGSVVNQSFVLPGTAGGAQETPGGGFSDAYVARFPADLSALTQATYLGGNRGESVNALAIHPTTGEVYAAGATESPDFPGGAQADPGAAFETGFVARLNGALTTLGQATYLGGLEFRSNEVHALSIHPFTGEAYVTGLTSSPTFPGTAGGVQPTKPNSGASTNMFVARLAASLTTLGQATYLGGSGSEAAARPSLSLHPATGDVYVASSTSSDFPGAAGSPQLGDGIVAWLTASLTVGADLALTKSHSGDFYRGQVGVTFTLTVRNVGAVATSGAVTVKDTLPAGLTATAIGGTGWSCTLATVTCTRSDPLDPGSTYPLITVTVTVAANAPGSLTNQATVTSGVDFLHDNDAAADPTSVSTFVDVPRQHFFYAWIEALAAAHITGGCAAGPPLYCPDDPITRAQMSVFLVRGLHGAGFDPPAATGTRFADVPATHPLAKWIEQLARDGLTGGCSASPPLFCPEAAVTRAEMAVFLLRLEHGAGYDPPAPTGTVFGDVPATHPLAKWIEQLAREGITGGCSASPPLFCPDAAATRAQMAVFMVRALHLSSAPPFAYVSTESGTLAVIDTSVDAVVATIALGSAAGAVVVNPASTRVYAATDAAIKVIDTATNFVAATIPVTSALHVLAIHPSGNPLYVTHSTTSRLTLIDTATNTVTGPFGPNGIFTGIAVSLDGTRIYVSEVVTGDFMVLDAATGAVRTVVSLHDQLGAMAFDPAGARLYAVRSLSGALAVIDTTTDSVVTSVTVQSGPAGVAVRPDGMRVYVANRFDNSISIVDTATNTVIATRSGGGEPTGVAVNPAGTRVYVANHTGNSVTLLDAVTNAAAGSIPAGQPIGIAMTGVHFFVPNTDTRASAPALR